MIHIVDGMQVRIVMLAYVACLAVVLLIASFFRKEGAKPDSKNKNQSKTKKKDSGNSGANAASCSLSLMDYDYNTGTRKYVGKDGNVPPLDPAKCKGISVKRKGVCYKSDGRAWTRDPSCKDAKSWLKIVAWKDPRIQKVAGKNYNIKGFEKYVNARPKNNDPINSQPIYASTPAECAKLCKTTGTPACVGFTFSNTYVKDNKGHLCVPVKSLQYGNQSDGARVDDGEFITDSSAKQWTTYAVKGYTPLSSGGQGGAVAGSMAPGAGTTAPGTTIKSISQIDGTGATKYSLKNTNNITYPYLAVNGNNCTDQDLYGGRTSDYPGAQWTLTGDNTSGYRVGNVYHNTSCPSDKLGYLQLDRTQYPLCKNNAKLRMGEYDKWILELTGDGLFKFRVNACDGDSKAWSYLYLNDSGDSQPVWLTNQENASVFQIIAI